MRHGALPGRLGWRPRWAVFLIAIITGAPAWGAAISAPYVENYNDGQAQDFTTAKSNAAASTWTLSGTNYNHVLAAPGSGTTQYAGSVAQVNNLAQPNDFQVQATVNVSSVAGASGVARVGLVGMAKAATVMGDFNTNALYYAGELTVAGSGVSGLFLRVGRGNTTIGTLASGVALPAAFALNQTYTMALTGDYDAGGNLTLSFSVGGATVTAAPIAAASVLVGQYFGIRDYTDNTRSLTATYDDLTISNVVAVPEPTVAGFVTLGAVGMLVRRRGH